MQGPHQVGHILIKTALFPFSNAAASRISCAVTLTTYPLSQPTRIIIKLINSILYSLGTIISYYNCYGLSSSPIRSCSDKRPELEQTGEKLGIISGILSKSSLILSYTSVFDGKE